jgi:hypothetical protein
MFNGFTVLALMRKFYKDTQSTYCVSYNLSSTEIGDEFIAQATYNKSAIAFAIIDIAFHHNLTC